ncbi:hypothetical protein A2572_01510 [Candidatus Collierbacteria bacterium RIFOXYD1_FULL_40_9]|uniref:Methyltransferase type 11 domain-containing protein n=1 Tax=Candidatus Collierbacteria bacterium RIFOXYD1_FULL_40_9 TaxID=1817731 RepID=A0A1F5FVP3_9BACT|nr:MAG: hypothetical protein A2572_01510 [Candidatus Collierbacteria bacterium RIFOXYD1_FULL_40_9]
MRDFRIQALIDLWKTIYKREIGVFELLNYLSYWLLPGKVKTLKANKFFDLKDFYLLKKIIFNLGKKDPAWFPRLIEPSTLGIRGWEYGHLFLKTKFAGKKILDVGPGSSRLPRFLADLGAKVTMLDMDKPLEATKLKKASNLKFVLGDMTKMNFSNNSFDIVICISAIEHVDMKGVSFYKSKEYKRRALLAIKEMVRVLKPDGTFYLTTDFYLKQQQGDKWKYSKNKIRGAFEIGFLKKMISSMNGAGIVFDSKPEYGTKLLVNGVNRANYRGRYFTTYAFSGKKAESLR